MSQIYKEAIQCTDKLTGKVGCFIYPSDKEMEAHSPVFNGLVELYVWLFKNGYRNKRIGLIAEYVKESE